jgi:hypothetical protein
VFSQHIQKIWDLCVSLESEQTPFTTFRWHKNYFSTIGKEETPVVLFDASLQTLAPFIQTGTTWSFSGGKEISDYMDIIGPNSAKVDAWEKIILDAKENDITTISLNNISESSPTLSFFQTYKETSEKKVDIMNEDTTPTITLPSSYEEYLTSLSHKDRHELERKLRKFIRENPTAHIETSTNTEEDIHILLTLMKMDTRKQTFLSPEYENFFLLLPSNFPEELALNFLYIDEEPVAGIVAFQNYSTFYLYNSGFNQEKYPGSGFYLKASHIRTAIEMHKTTYNFLQGNERYKYELGGKDAPVFSIRIEL